MRRNTFKNRNNFFGNKTHRLFNKPEGQDGGGGGGGTDAAKAAADKAAADKAAADAKIAADKATADAALAAEKAKAASAADKAALDKTAKDAQDAAAAATKVAESAKAAVDKIVADAAKAAADKAAADKLAAEADPEDDAELRIKNRDMKGIKERAAQAGLLRKAKELGFETVEAMEAAAKRAGNPAASATDLKIAELQKNQERLQAQLAKTVRESAVREAALVTGFADPAYAQFLVDQQLVGKTEAEAAAFDAKGFLDGFKKTAPHFFKAVEKPANSGNGSLPKPNAPGAKDVKEDAADGAKIDATKMTPEEFARASQARYGAFQN